MKRIILAVVLAVSLQAVAQVSSCPRFVQSESKGNYGFVRLDRATYQKQIADALVVLRRVKAEFESSGTK